MVTEKEGNYFNDVHIHIRNSPTKFRVKTTRKLQINYHKGNVDTRTTLLHIKYFKKQIKMYKKCTKHLLTGREILWDHAGCKIRIDE